MNPTFIIVAIVALLAGLLPFWGSFYIYICHGLGIAASLMAGFAVVKYGHRQVFLGLMAMVILLALGLIPFFQGVVPAMVFQGAYVVTAILLFVAKGKDLT